MSAAGDDAPHLLPLLGREHAAEPEVEQFGVSDDGIERRAQLVTHHGEEVGLGLVRLFRLRACLLLAHDLARRRLCLLPIGDVAQADEPRGLVLPPRLDDSQLGECRRVAAPRDLDLGLVRGGERIAERLADELGGSAAKQPFGRGVDEADQPLVAHDDDAVRELVDDLSHHVLRRLARINAPFRGTPVSRQVGRLDW